MVIIYRIIVRSRKDKKAVEAALRNFLKDWHNFIKVETLGGSRSIDKIVDYILDKCNTDRLFNIVLVPRSIRKLATSLDTIPFNMALTPIEKRDVRNARLHEILNSILRGMAEFRLRVYWLENEKAHTIYQVKNSILLSSKFSPFYDVYYALGAKHIMFWSKLLGSNLKSIPIVFKLDKGIHELYIGSSRIATLVLEEDKPPYKIRFSENALLDVQVDIRRSIDLNRKPLDFITELSKKLIKEAYEKVEPDAVIVPWSAGKDSTCTLKLTLEALGHEANIIPIYVHIDLDFPENLEYVNLVSKLLKVNVEIAECSLAEEVLKRGLPSRDDRWCTKLKIKALYDSIRKCSEKPLIVVGDRDSESLLRLKRPPLRSHEEFKQVAPIKFWSSLWVQFFLMSRKIPLNPLYYYGFYRLGCMICPLFRGWEIMLFDEYYKEKYKWKLAKASHERCEVDKR